MIFFCYCFISRLLGSLAGTSFLRYLGAISSTIYFAKIFACSCAGASGVPSVVSNYWMRSSNGKFCSTPSSNIQLLKLFRISKGNLLNYKGGFINAQEALYSGVQQGNDLLLLRVGQGYSLQIHFLVMIRHLLFNLNNIYHL